MSDRDETLRAMLHRVRAWALDVEDAIVLLRDLCGEEATPTTPPDAGSTLPGPPPVV